MTYRETSPIERYEPLPSTDLEVCMRNIEIQHKKKYNQIINQIKRASERGKRFVNIGLSTSDAVDCGFTLESVLSPLGSSFDDFNPHKLLWLQMLKEQGFKISFENLYRSYNAIQPCYPYRIIVRF